MQKINPTSPFQQVDFKPIEEEYSYDAKLTGLLLPSGQIIINYNHSTKSSMIADIARVLGAKTVLVEGTWTFKPKVQDEDE